MVLTNTFHINTVRVDATEIALGQGSCITSKWPWSYPWQRMVRFSTPDSIISHYSKWKQHWLCSLQNLTISIDLLAVTQETKGWLINLELRDYGSGTFPPSFSWFRNPSIVTLPGVVQTSFGCASPRVTCDCEVITHANPSTFDPPNTWCNLGVWILPDMNNMTSRMNGECVSAIYLCTEAGTWVLHWVLMGCPRSASPSWPHGISPPPHQWSSVSSWNSQQTWYGQQCCRNNSTNITDCSHQPLMHQSFVQPMFAK